MTAAIPFVVISTAFPQPRHLRFDQISVNEGLSQDIVRSIFQDSRGFMWFGTEDGLNRYDGYSIEVFKHDPRDSNSISQNDIDEIYEDRRQRLWIATGDGLNLLDRAGESFLHFKNDRRDPRSISSSRITAICEDSQGTLWIGTDNGLNRYDEQSGAFSSYFYEPASQSLGGNGINCIISGRSDTLWIGTNNGFCSFAGGNFVRYLWNSPPTEKVNVLRLYQDQSGAVWAACAEQSLWRLDASGKKPERVPARETAGIPLVSKTLANPVVTSMQEDGNGCLWIGHFSGLDVYDPRTKTFSHFPANPESRNTPGGRVETIYRDKDGSMWLGTYQHGVYRYDPLKQRFVLHRNDPKSENSLGSNHVLAVYEDRAGIVWIGTDRGLDRFDPRLNVFTHYRHDPSNPHSIASKEVNAILEDRLGNLWIGGIGETSSNLDRFDAREQKFVHYPLKSVRALHEDRDGELWVGLPDEANTGVNLARLDRSRNIAAHYSVSGTGVWCIYEDRSGNFWLGGQYCCLSRFDKRTDSFVHFDADPYDSTALGSGAVRTMCEDERGNLWLGTWGGGLFRYDPKTNRFSRFLEQGGLLSNYVKGILPDGHGNLWIATERGLSRFDPGRNTFRNFTTDEGLQGDRFLSGSCFRGPGGWMYFGGTEGLNMFHPDSIRENPHLPPVVITSFKVFDRSIHLPQAISATEEIQLAPDQDFFSFEFVALDYTASRRNRYMYMLEGFDRDWVEAGTRRYAAYTGVHPGEYIFRVRGSNNDGVWNNEGAVVRIHIAPPFWRTWWFALLAGLSIIALLYSLYQYRINRLLAIERLRTRIAGDLHDDVGTDLSSIVLATQSMERTLRLSDEERAEVRQIGRIASRTQDMMRDIVWVLNSRNDTIDDLTLKMREVAERVLKGISYTFKGPDAPLSGKMSLEFKRTLFLFYKECLNNIVRHSSATEAVIEFRAAGEELILRISDNGRGFDPSTATPGLGMKSLRARAQALGGNLDISGSAKDGTRISLTVKTT